MYYLSYSDFFLISPHKINPASLISGKVTRLTKKFSFLILKQ